MSKKKIYITVWFASLLIGLVLATFFDLNISKSIADTSDSLGLFLEKWGEPPSLVAVAFAFCGAGVYRMTKKTWQNYSLSSLCFIGSCVSLYSTIIRTVEYYNAPLSQKLSVVLVSVAGAVIISALFIFLCSKISYGTLYKMRYSFGFVIVAALFTLVIISAIKTGWGRIRFREIMAQGGNFDLFMPWYSPNGGGDVDGYKSFPSGHTSNATLLFACAYMIKDGLGKKAWKIANIAVLIWTAVIMFSRILCGAHFLSDVCAGAIFTSLIILICEKLFYKEDIN